MEEKKSRKKNQADAAKERAGDLGPYDLIRNLQRELASYQANKAFTEKRYPALRLKNPIDFPHVDIIEHENDLEICIECPGIDKNDLDIEIDEDSITVSGKVCEERVYQDGHLVGKYQCSKSMTRTVSLPRPIVPEKATARIIKNVIEIKAPKARKEKKKVRLSLE